MCSKEAWEHFIFVPTAAPRRLTRAVEHGIFLRVTPALAVSGDKSITCRRATTTTLVKASRTTSASCTSGCMSDLAVYGATAAVAYGAVALGGAAGMPVAGLLKISMMPPPPPPPLSVLSNQALARATALSSPSLVEMLFPGFNTDTFLFRVSMLQIVEYISSLLLGSSYGSPKLCSLYLLGASWGPAIADGAVWRLLMPMTLHANALHIFFNLVFQLRMGFVLEKQYGSRKFCLIYMFCGFVGNLLSVASDPMKLAVGASTSGFGLLGVYFAEALLKWDSHGARQPRVFLWLAMAVMSSVMMSTISANVDFIGHFGGAMAGFLMTVILADMPEEHQPSWYGKAKFIAKNVTPIIVVGGLIKAIAAGPTGPIPYCGTIFNPRDLPF